MIRILNKVRKRTKMHLTILFDHLGEEYRKTFVLPLDEYDSLTEQEIVGRVRAFAISHRHAMEQKALESAEKGEEVSELEEDSAEVEAE